MALTLTTRRWQPAAGIVALAWLLTAAAAGWCLASWLLLDDPAGRVLAGVAVLGTAVAALFLTRARPRLTADPGGLTIRGMLGSRHHPWPFVVGIRVLQVRRFGRRTALLEVDTLDVDGGERLYVFGRLDLDADPQDVAPELSALRPGAI